MATGTVKLLKEDAGSFFVGGYGVVWGGKDTDGEHFDKSTDFWFDRLTETPMVLYNHGQDRKIGAAVLGKVISHKIDDIGMWIEAQIKDHEKYSAAIKELISKGVLGWSSGSIGHLTERSNTGKITSWPVGEWSLTNTPAEPRTLGVRELANLSEMEPSLKSVLPEDLANKIDAEWATLLASLPDSDFAHIADSQRFLPIHDVDAVKATLASFEAVDLTDANKKKAARKIVARAKRFNVDVPSDSAVGIAAGHGHHVPQVKAADVESSYEDRIEDLTSAINGMFGQTVPGLPPTGYAYVRATFPDYVIVSYRSYDESDEGGDYRIDYTLEDDCIRLGTVTPMEQVWVPAKAADATHWQTIPIAVVYDIAAKYAQIALARTEDVAKRRLSEGRELSVGHRARFDAQLEANRKVVRAQEDLLRAITPPAKASADRLRLLESRTRLHVIQKQEITP